VNTTPPTSGQDHAPWADYSETPPAYPTDDERTWAMVSHLGSFAAAWLALGLFAPLLVLLIKGNQSPYVREHAVESLNFQLNALFWAGLGFLLLFVAVGLLVLPLVAIWYAVFVIIASARASRGELFRYPLILRLVR
jgi:uncharacterized protein